MKEIRDIIQAFDTAQAVGKQTALATVVHVEGSSYRRPGARMLITEDGELTGAISGGCLEGDALRKALYAMAQQRPMLVTYDTTDEDDAGLGARLGCQGIIQVLIEPIVPTREKNPIDFLKALNAQRQPAILVTLFSMTDKRGFHPGTCLLARQNGSLETGPVPMRDTLAGDADTLLQEQRSCFRNYIGNEKNLSAFFEYIEPPLSLVISGAGNDVVPLVAIAGILGWETMVIDGRPSGKNPQRFAPGCRVMASRPESALNNIPVDDRTVFLLMTHHYHHDKAMLRELVARDLKYIGMLGPKKKLERMLEEFRSEGLLLNEQQLSVIHSPVGLDIGAESPEEIALAILSEIKAVFSGREGLSLQSNTGAIHSRQELHFEEVIIPGKNIFPS